VIRWGKLKRAKEKPASEVPESEWHASSRSTAGAERHIDHDDPPVDGRKARPRPLGPTDPSAATPRDPGVATSRTEPLPEALEQPADDGQEHRAPDERPVPVPDDLLHGSDGLYHGPDALALDMGRAQDQSVPDGEGETLRDTALRGGSYLVGRELVGMVIRILGVVVVTRLIGPRDFGIYSGAAAFIVVAVTMAQMGMEVYLIRQPEEPTIDTYNAVFTFVLTLSAMSVVFALVLSAIVEHIHPSAAAGVRVFRVLLISIPLNALWAPAQARIERSLGFRKLALLELGGDALLYGTAVPLAVLGWGPYSLVVGIIVWQSWLLVGSYRMARMVPRVTWPNAMWSDFLRHGLTYSSSSWVITVSGLANPGLLT